MKRIIMSVIGLTFAGVAYITTEAAPLASLIALGLMLSAIVYILHPCSE